MSKFKTKCHICRHSTKGETPPASCKYCNADLLNPQNESLKKQMMNVLYDGWQGSLILTDRRLIFFRVTRVGSGSTTILGGIFAADSILELRKQRLSFSIPVSSIQSVEIGLSGQTLLVRVNDGTLYELPLPKKRLEEWKDAILRLST